MYGYVDSIRNPLIANNDSPQEMSWVTSTNKSIFLHLFARVVVTDGQSLQVIFSQFLYLS